MPRKYIPPLAWTCPSACRPIFLGLLLLGLPNLLPAATNPDSLAHSELRPVSHPETTAAARFSFPELDQQLNNSAPTPPPGDNLLDELLTIEQANQNLQSVQRARDLVNRARATGNFLRRLDSLAFIEFPVVLADTISNVPIAIVFDGLRLYPEYAQLTVVVEMQLPQRRIQSGPSGGEDYVYLYFGTPDLKLSHDGGIIGDATVGLFGDVPIGTGNPDRFGFVLRGWQEGGDGGDLGTFVRIDCDGFVELGLAAEVLFSRDWIVPVSSDGSPQATGRVRGEIQTVVTDWNDLLVELSLPDFALAQYDDLAFHLNTAVLDFSDYRNSPNVVFPPAYAERHLLPENPNLWRGVYIRQLEVTLPPQFVNQDCAQAPTQPGDPNFGTGSLWLDDRGSGAWTGGSELAAQRGPNPTAAPVPYRPEAEPAQPSDNGCRTRAGVEHLLIDNQGVSGLFYAENVLDLDAGNMDGWRFSVSDVEVEVVTSDLVGFGFGGEVGIPIARKSRPFRYAAFVNIPDRSYAFTLQTEDSYEFPLFQLGEVSIDSASYIQVVAQPDRFQPTAVLYGHAAVRARWKKPEDPAGDELETEPDKIVFDAARLDFAGLRLTTQAPYLDLEPGGYFAFSNDLRLVNFPVSIATPELRSLPDGRVRLGIGVSLNLMNQEDGGFAAGCGVGIVGKLIKENGYQRWQYEALELDSIAVAIHLTKVKIDGKAIIFRDDPTYGRGWQGNLQVDILDGKFTFDLNALFGRTTHKYWYVDGLVTGSAIRIDLVPGVLYINGFGGGAYYHMRMAGMGGPGEALYGPGVISSGVRYVPDEEIALGVKASVSMRTQVELLTSVSTFEMAFTGTGLQEVLYYGRAEIMAPEFEIAGGQITGELQDRLDQLGEDRETVQAQDGAAVSNPSNAILTTAFLRMNFTNGLEYQGTTRVYLDAAEGTITGTGGIDLLFSAPRDRWHIYIGGYENQAIIAGDGAPLPPVSVDIYYENDPDLPGDDILITVGAYLLTGNDIPGPPPLHPAAAAYFNTSSAASNNRAGLAGSAALGTGFAFGAYALVDLDVDLYKTKKNGNKKKKGWFRAEVGAGFDLSLLKYGSSTYCSESGDSPHGHHGWRATGRIWAYVDGRAKWGLFKKNLSIGLLLDADVPQPSYFLVYLKFRILLININLEVPVGERCGVPYMG